MIGAVTVVVVAGCPKESAPLPSRVADAAPDVEAATSGPADVVPDSAGQGSAGSKIKPPPTFPQFRDDPGEAGRWVKGRLSRMRARRVRSPQHDKAPGSTEIEFGKQAAGSAADKVMTKLGQWRVISYLDDARAYLLGGIFQRGAWLPLVNLAFVDEATGAWRDSYVNGSRWMAMAAVPSPRGRFVAFVANNGDAFELQVLDTRADTLVRVGQPPSPPPMGKEDWDMCTDNRASTWGDLADGFLDMDRGIVTFPGEQTLAVSYGRDSCRRRSPQRRVRRWNLPALIERKPRVVPATFGATE